MSDVKEVKEGIHVDGSLKAPADAKAAKAPPIDSGGLILGEATGILKDKKKKRTTATKKKSSGTASLFTKLSSSVSDGASKKSIYAQLDTLYAKVSAKKKEAIAKIKYALQDGKSKKTVLAAIEAVRE